jgi:hypothetical protein
MTAVESCPRCGKSQRDASPRCDHCGVAFDHCIEPPPRTWPVLLWWTAVVGSIVLLLFLVARSVWASEVIVKEVSLEETVAQSAVIVLARRLNDNPIVVRGPQEEFNTVFQIWTFEIVDGYKYLYRNALPRKIHVIQAYTSQELENQRDSLKGSPGTDIRLGYRADDPLRLEEVGSDPVILFLNLAQGLNLAPDQPDDLYELQYVDSIEKASAHIRIARLLRTEKAE